MNFFLQPLTLLTFFPLVGVLILLFIPSDRKNALRWIGAGHHADHVPALPLGADHVPPVGPEPAAGGTL